MSGKKEKARFESFPHIESFTNFCKEFHQTNALRIKYESENNLSHKKIDSVVNFVGTVKAHGTNASIILRPTVNEAKYLQYQSRNHVLGDGVDNAGFKGFCQKQGTEEEIWGLFEHVKEILNGKKMNYANMEILLDRVRLSLINSGS